jgi:hypothetical protein
MLEQEWQYSHSEVAVKAHNLFELVLAPAPQAKRSSSMSDSSALVV